MNTLMANKNKFNKICSTLYHYLCTHEFRVRICIYLTSLNDINVSANFLYSMHNGKVYPIQEGDRIYIVWEPKISVTGEPDLGDYYRFNSLTDDKLVQSICYIISDDFYKKYYPNSYEEMSKSVGITAEEILKAVDSKNFKAVDSKVKLSSVYKTLQEKLKYYSSLNPKIELKEEVCKKLKVRNVIPLVWYEVNTNVINYPYLRLTYGARLMSTKVRAERDINMFLGECKRLCSTSVDNTPYLKWIVCKYTSYEGKEITENL